jgi:hypothetical protein
MVGFISPASLKISPQWLEPEGNLKKISFKFQVFKKPTDINFNQPKLIILGRGSN